MNQAAPYLMAAQKAQEGARKVLTSPIFWVLVLLIVFLIVRRNWRRIAANFSPDLGAYGDGNLADLSSSEKNYLSKLANDIYDATEGVPYTSQQYGARNELFRQAAQLSDNQLKWLANYYKTAMPRKESLFECVQGEWFTGDAGEDLMARLSTLGEM